MSHHLKVPRTPNANAAVNQRVLLTRERESSGESFRAAERTPPFAFGVLEPAPEPERFRRGVADTKTLRKKARNAKRREHSFPA